jgi:hypothetical protein
VFGADIKQTNGIRTFACWIYVDQPPLQKFDVIFRIDAPNVFQNLVEGKARGPRSTWGSLSGRGSKRSSNPITISFGKRTRSSSSTFSIGVESVIG